MVKATIKSTPAPKVKKTTKVVSGVKAPLFNIKAESLGDYSLPKTVFDVTVDPKTIAVALRVFKSNQRTANPVVKGRGDVGGTTKKMWAQKGTGRARHGSAKAPQFVGGGSAHGPVGNQNFEKKINKKVKTLVFNGILSQFAKNESIIVIDQFQDLLPKTKEAWKFVDALEKSNKTLANSKKIGIITNAPLQNVKRAFGNIPGLNYFSLKSLNYMELANQNFLIFSATAVEELAK